MTFLHTMWSVHAQLALLQLVGIYERQMLKMRERKEQQ